MNSTTFGCESHLIHSIDELPLALTVPELSHILRIGRGAAYDMVRCGAIASIRIGRQLRIPRQAVVDYLQNAT